MGTNESEFKGLVIADLIGAPLRAACDAQVKLAQATVDFIKLIGFQPPAISKLADYSETAVTPPKAAIAKDTHPSATIPQADLAKVHDAVSHGRGCRN